MTRSMCDEFRADLVVDFHLSDEPVEDEGLKRNDSRNGALQRFNPRTPSTFTIPTAREIAVHIDYFAGAERSQSWAMAATALPTSSGCPNAQWASARQRSVCRIWPHRAGHVGGDDAGTDS